MSGLKPGPISEAAARTRTTADSYRNDNKENYRAGRTIPGGCAGMTSSGAFAYFGLTNAYIPISPRTQSAVPPTAQTYPKFFRALLPGVIPHFAANSQIP